MGVKSEYQKQFQVSTLKKFFPIYLENLAFRTARRNREFSHTPLSWCDDDTDETESIESDIVEDTNPTTVEQICKVTASEEESLLNKRETDCVENSKFLNLCLQDSTEYDEVQLQKNKVKTKVPGSLSAVRSKRQRRPDRRNNIPSPNRRTKSSSSARIAPTIIQHPAPFVSYGWGRKEYDLSAHKTFNIKATAGVHPDAIRAKNRRTVAAVKTKEDLLAKSKEHVRQMLEKSCVTKDEASEWQTEYQLRYPAYDTKEYVRSLSARSTERTLGRVIYVT